MHNLVVGMKNMKEMIGEWSASPMSVDEYAMGKAKHTREVFSK